MSEKGKSVKDPDKRAIVTVKALNTVRTSQSLLGHLQRLANSLASKISAREEDFEAIVASCVTWLWSGVSSLCQMSSGTVSAETFSVDKLSVDQKAKVLYHGGWAFMRVRENINAAPRNKAAGIPAPKTFFRGVTPNETIEGLSLAFCVAPRGHR